MISFNIDLAPKPKQSARFTKRGFAFQPKEVKQYQEYISVKAAEAMQGSKIFEGPIEVELRFYLKEPKSKNMKYPLKRPDIDNLSKSVLDGMNGFVYNDDKQIIKLVLYKFYGEPRTEIKVKEFDEKF